MYPIPIDITRTYSSVFEFCGEQLHCMGANMKPKNIIFLLLFKVKEVFHYDFYRPIALLQVCSFEKI